MMERDSSVLIYDSGWCIRIYDLTSSKALREMVEVDVES